MQQLSQELKKDGCDTRGIDGAIDQFNIFIKSFTDATNLLRIFTVAKDKPSAPLVT